MIKLNEDEKAGYDILAPHMPEDLAIDIIKHRRAKKAKLTARVARSLLREYQAYGNVDKAAEIHLTRGWVAFEAAWAANSSRYTDQNHPTPRQSANYGNYEPAPAQAVEQVSPERRKELADMARRVARSLTVQ